MSKDQCCKMINITILFTILLACQMIVIRAALIKNKDDLLSRPNSKIINPNSIYDFPNSTIGFEDHPLDKFSRDLCVTEACIHTSSSILSKIDHSVRPCQDFYKFACGKWQSDHEYKLKEGQLYYAINFDVLPEKINNILKRLLHKTERIEESFYTSEPYVQLTDFYDSCMNVETIEKLGAEPAINLLKSLQHFQYGKPFDKHKWNLEAAMLELLKLNGAVLVDISLDPQLSQQSNWDIAVTIPNHDILSPSAGWAQRDDLRESTKFHRKTFFAEPQNPSRRFEHFKKMEDKMYANVHKTSPLTKSIKGSDLNPKPLDEVENNVHFSDIESSVNTLQNNFGPSPPAKRPPVKGPPSTNNDCAGDIDDLTENDVGAKTISRKQLYSLIKTSTDKEAFTDMKEYLKIILKPAYMAEANSTQNSTLPKTFEEFLNNVTHFVDQLRKAEPSIRERALDQQNGKVFTIYKFSQLQAEFQIINWTSVVRKLVKKEIFSNSSVVVNFPRHLKKLNAILYNTEPWLLHYGMISVFANDLMKKLITITEDGKREDFCYKTTKNLFQDVYAYMYLKFVGKNKLDELRKTMQPFVSHLTDSLINKINKSSQICQSDRETAIKKIKAINWQLGGTEKWLNLTLLEEKHRNFTVSNSSFFDNIIDIFKLARRDLYTLYNDTTGLDKETEIWLLTTSPYIINAFYLLSENSIVAPMAIFQPPYHYPNAPDYINYGATGVALAHEMVHALDYTGSMFNSEGVFQKTFCDGYQKQLLNSMKCFNCMTTKHFTKYTNLHNIRIKLEIDTELTHNENYADIIGLSTAYDAFKKHSSEKRHTQLLPGGGFSQEQLFFLSFAQPYCALLPTVAKAVLMEFDEHLPHDYRINALLKNNVEFSQAFGCAKTDYMYTDEACPIL